MLQSFFSTDVTNLEVRAETLTANRNPIKAVDTVCTTNKHEIKILGEKKEITKAAQTCHKTARKKNEK